MQNFDLHFGPSSDTWISIAAVLISLAAFGVAIWQTRLQQKATQLQICENAFIQVRDAEAEIYKLLLESKAGSDGYAEDDPDLTAFRFFNTVEYLAMLINQNFISIAALRRFFEPGFEHWHDEYLSFYRKDFNDPARFSEFKKLYKSIKHRQNRAL